MKLNFHAKSCIRGFYHYLTRNMIQVRTKSIWLYLENLFLKDKVVHRYIRRMVLFEDCKGLSLK
jgi:hypothetical protein